MKLLEGMEQYFLTANVEIIIDGNIIWTVVAVSETDDEDALLGNNLPGIMS